METNLYLIDTDVWLDLTKQICLIRKSPYTRKVAKLPNGITIQEFMAKLFPKNAEFCVTREIKEKYLNAFDGREFMNDISEEVKNEVYDYMCSLSEGTLEDQWNYLSN